MTTRSKGLLRMMLILCAGLALAGCDKCGHRVTINAPSIPHACGDNAADAR